MMYFTSFTLISFSFKGSTVNMNIMGWVYNKVATAVGAPGHTALGASLMLGITFTLIARALLKEKSSCMHSDSGYIISISICKTYSLCSLKLLISVNTTSRDREKWYRELKVSPCNRWVTSQNRRHFLLFFFFSVLKCFHFYRPGS